MPNEVKGVGLGLRASHFAFVLENSPKVPWFEVTSENFMGIKEGFGGKPLAVLEELRRDYPFVLHGVSLSIGSTDSLNMDYLRKLRQLIGRVEPTLVSDHFCWTGVEGENLHDLMPLPFTGESVDHLVDRIRYVQDFLGRRIFLENVSSYLTFAHSEMTEWEFISEVSDKSDCGILLDVNNVFVSSINHGFEAVKFLEGIPKSKIGYLHLAGFSEENGLLIDTHDHPVSDGVWKLFENACQILGPVPTLIEWDAQIPEFTGLMEEADKASAIQKGASC